MDNYTRTILFGILAGASLNLWLDESWAGVCLLSVVLIINSFIEKIKNEK